MTFRKFFNVLTAFLLIAGCFGAPRGVRAQILTVGATNLVDASQISGNEIDPSIAIDVLNPSNMVIAAAIDSQPAGLLISMTTNMGATWATNIIATNNDSQGLVPAYGEPSVAWDTYGNLFVTYLPATLEGVVVAVSTNGGQTFGVLTNLAAADSTDQPKITTPPAGAATGSVWVVYKDYSMAGTPLVVQGMQSSGLGTNGIFTSLELVPGSSAGGFADISAGPKGEVMVGFQNNTYSSGLAQIFITVNTNEITTNGLGTNDFPQPVQVVSDAIGGFTYIPAEPSGVGLNSALSLAWDCDTFSLTFDRAYLTYTDQSTNGNLDISFCYSTNGGANWSAEEQVNDDTGQNDHFLPRMAVDPSTGIIGISWLDCRNDQGSTSMVITRTFTDKVTLSDLMVTNIIINPTNAALNNPSITYSWVDTSGGNGSNLMISISGNDIVGTLATNDTSDNIYIYGGTNTNFVINVQGESTNFNATVTIVITDDYPDAFTSGSGAADESAIAYATASLDGGMTFQPNLPLISASLPINPPADGFASSLANSDSVNGWGHYTAMAAYGANFFPVWPDNSDILTNNPDGAGTDFDIYTISGGMSIPTADVSVFVTNSPNPVLSDGTLVYTIIVSNNGPKTAQSVFVTNILPQNVSLVAGGVKPAVGGTYQLDGQEIIFALPNIAANKTLTNTIRVTATGSAFATNFTEAVSSQIDLFPLNNSTNVVLLIAGQDLALGMTSSETNVLIGDTVTNWIVVTNLGPAANQPVMITNLLSANWTNIAVQAQGTASVSNNVVSIDLGIQPVGQAVTSIVTAVATSQGTFASSLATVSSQDIDTNLANNTAAITYFVNGEDLAIGISASPTNINLGDTVTYTITVTNRGLSYTGDITVTNLISTNLGQINIIPSQGEVAVFNNGTNNVVTFDLGELSAGEVATQILTAVALSGPHLATNIGMIGSTDFDTNKPIDATNVISINGEDLGISLSASPLSLQVGQVVTFTENVTNFGPSTNGVVLVTNVLSSRLGQLEVVQPSDNYTLNGNTVVFNFGTLTGGQTEAITLTAVPQSAGTGTNTGTVFSPDFDTNLVNNTAKAIITITPGLPMISNLVVTPLATSAFVRWKTGALATGQVQYGLTPSYGSVSSLSAIASSNHLVLLTGLLPDTNYYFNVESFVSGILYSTNGTFSTSDTLILNTQDANYSGLWISSSVGTGIYNNGYFNAANTTNINPTAWAVYAPNIPVAGNYDVSIWYPQNPIYTTNAQVYVSGATNEFIVSINQTTGGGAWDPIGTNVYFAAGNGGNVTIYNDTEETNKTIVANAMRWIYDPGQDAPTNGSVPAWWATYFFGTNVNVSGAADSDGDGYSNYAEYVLGTDPTDPTSHLNFSVASGPDGTVTVTFAPFQGGRIYQLLAATNLANPVWIGLTNNVSVNSSGDGVFTITQPNAASSFYKLSAQVAAP